MLFWWICAPLHWGGAHEIFFPLPFSFKKDFLRLMRPQAMILSELRFLSDLHYFLHSYECVGILIIFFFLTMGRRSAECHECRALLSGWWITRRFKASDPFQPDYTAAVNGDTFRHSSHRHCSHMNGLRFICRCSISLTWGHRVGA